MISNKYKLIQKLSQGQFGIIYKAENVRTNDYVAIKFEAKQFETKTLKNEAKIYQYLGKQNGFPQLKWYGSEEKYNYLVIDLLGPSLTNIIDLYKSLSLKTTLILGIQIISRIQLLHNKCLLHRDIKPNNFLLGLNEQTNKLFLIDFGFAKRYDFNGKHITEKKINGIIGSPNFVSLNVHNNIEPSRRDDLESCIYIIVYMLYGTLDWFGKDMDTMRVLKLQLTNKIKYSFLKEMLEYVRTIMFDEIPNYLYLLNLLVDEFNKNGFVNDNKFEWL